MSVSCDCAKWLRSALAAVFVVQIDDMLCKLSDAVRGTAELHTWSNIVKFKAHETKRNQHRFYGAELSFSDCLCSTIPVIPIVIAVA